MSLKARALIDVTLLLGLATLAFSLSQWKQAEPVRFMWYLLLAFLASGLKLRLPGIDSTFSLISVFVMIAVLELSLTEAVFMSCAGTVVQCYWHSQRRPKPIQVLFSVASMTMAVAAAYFVYHSSLFELLGRNLPLMLLAAGLTFFVTNTIPIAAIIALTENKPLRGFWTDNYLWCLPYYLVAAAIAGIINICSRGIGWYTWLLVVPVVYSIHQSCGLYLGKAEAEKKHLLDVAQLQLRTIETLALAIEAKDITTHDHLRRVRTYSVEMGRRLGLGAEELEALQAAAVLHDVGKLAIPEYIISKPGKLTLDEFEKMKVHTVVGAEIVERVGFPYPVAPIVRAHHEKWDGTGYPYGLKGEEIPMGARILAAVDCFDALASDRQYRCALPLDKAMKIVAADAGKSFDPRVVKVFEGCYVELEQAVQAQQTQERSLSKDLKIENGRAPDAGFENSDSPLLAGARAESLDAASAIAAVSHEIQMLSELSKGLGNCLSLGEILSIFCLRLKQTVQYDSVAVYLRQEDRLVPEYVGGDDSGLLSSLQIPVGQGLSGWVAEHCRPILNGNPAVEPGYLKDRTKFTKLRSAVAVPIKSGDVLIGVLALYRADVDAFSRDHLRILLAVASKLSLLIEKTLQRRADSCGPTADTRTRVPHQQGLLLQLHRNINLEN
ncbi:MAG TPA: HD domain-containing phosphohydrolase [Terriglobales bacterium]|nr:HD domain-containing phosphohydrolase [Terriglobales bacterium]